MSRSVQGRDLPKAGSSRNESHQTRLGNPTSLKEFRGREWTKAVHDAIECGSSREPLPSLIQHFAWLQGYDLRQSTSIQLIPSFPANRPGSRSGLGGFVPGVHKKTKAVH